MPTFWPLIFFDRNSVTTPPSPKWKISLGWKSRCWKILAYDYLLYYHILFFSFSLFLRIHYTYNYHFTTPIFQHHSAAAALVSSVLSLSLFIQDEYIPRRISYTLFLLPFCRYIFSILFLCSAPYLISPSKLVQKYCKNDHAHSFQSFSLFSLLSLPYIIS